MRGVRRAAYIALALVFSACAGRHANVTPAFTVGKAGVDYYCAPTAAAAKLIAKTLATADEDAYRDAIYGAYPLLPGTHVTEIDVGSGLASPGVASPVHVHITDGPYAGETCWYPPTVKGLLLSS